MPTGNPPILKEFALRIEKASYDKATNERRFRAVASDIDDDLRQDNMTLELFKSFTDRIENGDLVPELFQSDFWKGGMPYISISHYDDLNGDGVPGIVDKVYIDGTFLKALGKFSDTEIGRRCFEAICNDLYSETPNEDKIRISIGFLDWKHRHKSNGNVFERKSLSEFCPDCLTEIITGESEGIEFLDGQLVHLALTRVPANPRTMMEVEKSMTTQKEDAASIVGEDVAEELEEKSQQINKADFLVTKMDEKDPKKDDEEEDDEEKEMKDKKMKSTADDGMAELKAQISELKGLLTPTSPVSEPHPLDDAIGVLKSAYDQVVSADGISPEDKLKALQQPFEHLGNFVSESIRGTETPEQQEKDVMGTLVETLSALNSKMDMLTTQLSTQKSQSPIQQPTTPERRQINPAQVQMSTAQQPSLYKDGKLNIAAYARKSVGLN